MSLERNDFVNPIAFDFTLIAQLISFLFFSFLICIVVYILVFFLKKRKNDKEILEKLDRIVDLLEKNEKKS